jgi:hypothetical protein
MPKTQSSAAAQPEQQESAETPPVKYAPLEDLVPQRAADPLRESYTLPGTDLTFEIIGIAGYDERVALLSDIDLHIGEAKAGRLKVAVGDEKYTPIAKHIEYAFWCAACIQTPKLTRRQYLQMAYNKAGWLSLLWLRCLVCSRQIDDADTKLPDGLDAAKAALRKDPLD